MNKVDLYDIILLNNDLSNTDLKLIVVLSRCSFFRDTYIPTKKLVTLMRKYIPNISNRTIVRSLKKLKDNKIIDYWAYNDKRYFKFIKDTNIDWNI